MTRIVWLTDIHLNFVADRAADLFLQNVAETDADVVLISGDIAEAHNVRDYLERIDDALGRPVYFVLGNHDFYFSSITRVRANIETLCNERPNLTYLSAAAPIELTPNVGLVGHDGWADGRVGDYHNSPVMLNDYRLIDELSGMSKRERGEVLMRLGDEAAAYIRGVLPKALERFSEVYLVTHVPPLREACWHEGRLSDDDWAPHFACQAMGDAILEVMSDHLDKKLTVLCGHTHGSGETRPLDNVLILTGGAEYRRPSITRVFELR